VEDETLYLQRNLERYRRLLRGITDKRMSRELERMIEEAMARLQEIKRRR
jgi:hypothetical protein